MKRQTLLMAVAMGACATPGARPHDMGDEQHRTEAVHHDQLAAQEAAQYDANATPRRSPCPAARVRAEYASAYDACWSSVVNPTEKHKNEADAHRKHAADHRAASVALREAEARACVGMAEGDRDMSPFMHTEDIATVTPLNEGASSGKSPSYRMAGATIIFRAVPGMTAEWMQRLVDCHLARNSALGHVAPEMPNCQLVPKGVTARVKSAGDGFAVEVRSDDPATAREVLDRAERLVGIPVSAR